jgi:hypothetical protein
MFVRFRLTPWNVEEAHKVVAHYTGFGVPVVMTFMRYSDRKNIPRHAWSLFEWTHHVLSDYWMLRKEHRASIMKVWKDNPLVRQCGTLESSYCKDCGNCYNLYWEWKNAKGLA